MIYCINVTHCPLSSNIIPSLLDNTATNANLVIGDVAGEKANIAIKATPNQNWIYLAAATTQGTAITPTTSGVVIIDPDDINIYGGNYPFTINVVDVPDRVVFSVKNQMH